MTGDLFAEASGDRSSGVSTPGVSTPGVSTPVRSSADGLRPSDRVRAAALRAGVPRSSMPAPLPRPVHWQVEKGRGAVGNPQGRFETEQRAEFDDGWIRVESEQDQSLRTEVRLEQVKSILSRNDSPDVPFDQSINPYRGCEHGCIYCFARPTHSFLGLSPGQDFESRLIAKINAAQCLRTELAAPGYRCSPINIGAATDPYQPIERQYRITRSVIEVLSECDHPLTIVTKGALVERDIDLLAPMAAKGLATVAVSITTLDQKLASIWEPRATAPWRRIETIRRLTEAGIPTMVLVAPIVPFINDEDVERIIEAAHEAGACSASFTVLRLPHELKDIFQQWLQAHFPLRAKRVMSHVADLRDGRLNDSEYFTRMKGRGAWSDLIRLRVNMCTRRLGMHRDRLPSRTDLFRPPEKPGADAAGSGQLGLF